MAQLLKRNGFAGPMQAIGRQVWFKNFDKGSAMTQADLDALVNLVKLTSTITVVGTFVAGTSTSVNMVIEGADVSTVAGYTVSAVEGF